MKKIISCLLLILITHALMAQDSAIVVDKVAAVVGRRIVKLSDIENGYVNIRLHQGKTNDPFATRCSLLESALIAKLLVHKGIVDSIEVSDDEVETQVQAALKSLTRQYGSREAILQATGFSVDEFHDIYFDIVKDQLMSQRVQYNLTQNVKVTPAEVTEFYLKIPKDSVPTIDEEYEVSEIVLCPQISQAENDRVSLELTKLRERIIGGDKFSMLATLYSQDPASAKKGGEVGFFTRGDMVPEFEAAAFALKPGEVSPIIKTRYGYHILQLIERRGNSVNVRHILMMPKVQPQDLLLARIRLDSIAQAIRLDSITFEEAAAQYSEVPSKTLGGNITNPQTGNRRFTKEVFQSLFPGIGITGMKVGDISQATQMEDEDGKSVYRIIKLVKKVESHLANLEDDYDKIAVAALQQAKQNKLFDWAAKMAKNTYIRIDDDFKDCSFRIDWFNKKQ